MIIKSLKINGFGKLINANYDFNEKLNIIYGKNEAGKSTTHSFIKAMFFGINYRPKNSTITNSVRFTPWDDETNFSGELTFIYKNNQYTIKRNFNSDKDNFTFTIFNDTLKLDVKNPEIFLNSVLSNLTESSFNNTISISQLKSTTEHSMINELKKYIANINTSGDISINTLYSIELLKKQKRDIEAKQTKGATANYTKILGSIKNKERELSEEKYKNLIPELNNQQANNNLKIASNKEEIKKLQSEITEIYNELHKHDFDNKEDIDTLKIEVVKFIREYNKLKNSIKNATKFFANVMMIIVGIILAVLNTMFLIVTFPQIANFLNIYTVTSSFTLYKNVLSLIPIPPAIIIITLYILAFTLIISGMLLLISNSQASVKLKEITNVLSSVFYDHINTPVVNKSNISVFNEYLDKMYDLASSAKNKNSKIEELNATNEKLSEENIHMIEEIDKQKSLQFEVEKLVENLNEMKIQAEKLKKAISINDKLQTEIDSIKLSIDMLTELSNKVQIMFGTYINEGASKYISNITNGLYDSLNVDNSLNITVNTQNRIVSLEQLSKGTIDQFYLALRLAIIDMINARNEYLPLIFDDCFALYDDERLKTTLNWLSKNYVGQIIIFTCHTREAQILKENNFNFNYVEI